MLLNKVGEALYYEGKRYVVGEPIIANEQSEFEGLFGVITEIRDGEDKETENETPDIYCEFEDPVLKSDIKKLEETMSDLYDEPKKLEDIALDMVIMAPDMITTLAEIEENSPTTSIFLLTEDWAMNDAYGHTTEAFTSLDMAQMRMKELLAKEKDQGCIPVWEDNTVFVETEDEMSYQGYIEGFWSESHYELTIQEVPMRMSPAFLRQAADEFNIQSKQNDFIEQTESWESLHKLPDETIYELTHSKAIAERVENKLNKNDSYWEAYWESFSEVAHDMIREAGGEIS